MAVNNGDVIRVTTKCSLEDQDLQNVYHVQHQGTGGVSDTTWFQACRVWLDGAYDNMDPGVQDTITYDSIEAYNLTQDTYIGEDVWPIQTVGGSATTDMLPRQTAPLARFLTNTLRSQGRKFLLPLVEGWCSGQGELAATTLTNMALYAADILTGFTVGGDDVVPGNYRKIGAVFIEWVGSVINSYFATQRRRSPSIGS